MKEQRKAWAAGLFAQEAHRASMLAILGEPPPPPTEEDEMRHLVDVLNREYGTAAIVSITSGVMKFTVDGFTLTMEKTREA